MNNIVSKSVLSGWQTELNGKLIGPIFQKTTDLWDWQKTVLKEILIHQSYIDETINIDINSSMGWININKGDVFIQGEEAYNLIDEIDKLWDRLQYIDKKACIYSVLHDYFDLLNS